jgi:hypothetical protein
VLYREFLADEVTVLVSPFRGYRALTDRAEPAAARVLALRILLFLLVVAVAGSLTTAGRVVPLHFVSIAMAWLFVPAIHALVVTATRLACPKKLPLARAIGLHMAGNGPYLALFLLLSAIIAVLPDPGAALRWLLSTSVLLVVVLAAIVGGSITSFAFYRICGEATRGRAAALLFFEWVVKVLLCIAWYASIDNIAPQFFGPRSGG